MTRSVENAPIAVLAAEVDRKFAGVYEYMRENA